MVPLEALQTGRNRKHANRIEVLDAENWLAFKVTVIDSWLSVW